MYHMVRLANRHGAVTCTLIGMFFLIRGTSGAEINTSLAVSVSASTAGDQPPDEPVDDSGDEFVDAILADDDEADVH